MHKPLIEVVSMQILTNMSQLADHDIGGIGPDHLPKPMINILVRYETRLFCQIFKLR